MMRSFNDSAFFLSNKMNNLQSLIIGVVEGITEFLPISSTAHMRITEGLLGIDNNDKFTKVFTIAVQMGAILSVVFLYWKKFIQIKNPSFYSKLFIAVLPALILGYLLGNQIDKILEKPLVLAVIMILGGVLFLFIDKIFVDHVIDTNEKIKNSDALKIGLFQCLAVLFPGLSRSASTILGGMSLKLTRALAAEFSFFLAVPTMAAATAYSVFVKNWNVDSEGLALAGNKIHGYELITASSASITSFVIGNIAAFILAMLAIRFFIKFLQKNGFKLWGYYRIIAGLVTLLLIYKGYLLD